MGHGKGKRTTRGCVVTRRTDHAGISMNQVEAVKTKEQRDQVEAHLQEEAGRIYFDIWKLGLNTALRISDLLSLTMADVKALDAKAPVLELKEKKTGKYRRIVLNKSAFKVLQSSSETPISSSETPIVTRPLLLDPIPLLTNRRRE